MNFSDFLPSTKMLEPWKLFQTNDGKPALQSFARNFGEGLSNKATADFTNQHLLGDAGPQAPSSQSLQPQQLPQGGIAGQQAGGTGTSPMLMLVQKWMQSQGGPQ